MDGRQCSRSDIPWLSLCESLIVDVMIALSPLGLCLNDCRQLEWEWGKSVYVRGCVHKMMAKWLFHSLSHFDLEPRAAQLHPLNMHNAPRHRVHKEPCPLQSGYCEAQACEICLWSCLGMRDYGGFRLWSPKLYVRTPTDGEIHDELCTQWSFISQQMRGPKIAERSRIQDSVLCATSRSSVVCWAEHWTLTTPQKGIN